ncbi:hypothetical protein [Streptomyces sp. NBC_00347]|uniref:hypothetical protein n=1 Tax=Streptomyces sp. NBC_00347 TaxID=2975721 RepID=UPI00225C294A|nr:hypothetical protein [Streptomyces sp. NBC_00347]MCX5129400.1 hypothetical protein [Streptomyces sp. NBC_00347]
MTLITALILVAVAALIGLLALAPSAPARRNPFPVRRHRAAHRRKATPRPNSLPGQRGIHHHTR